MKFERGKREELDIVSGLRNVCRKREREKDRQTERERKNAYGKSSLVYPASAHPRGHRLAAVVTHIATKAAGACRPTHTQRERERGTGPTASALEIGNHIAGYTDYYAIRA